MCSKRIYEYSIKDFNDKVNKENVRLVTLKFEDFCKEGTEKQFDENTRFIYGKLKKLL